MNVVEMTHSFLLKAKTLDKTNIDSVKTYDIVMLLNNAQEVVIDELIKAKALQHLRPITTSSEVLAADFDSSYKHGITAATAGCVDLSDLTSYRSYVRSQSEMTRTQVPAVLVASKVANEEIIDDILYNIETTGTNYPIFTNPKAIVEGDYLVVIADAYTTLTKIIVVYVRDAKILVLTSGEEDGTHTTTCELPTDFHQRIVDVALNIYYSNMNALDDQKRKQKDKEE